MVLEHQNHYMGMLKSTIHPNSSYLVLLYCSEVWKRVTLVELEPRL